MTVGTWVHISWSDISKSSSPPAPRPLSPMTQSLIQVSVQISFPQRRLSWKQPPPSLHSLHSTSHHLTFGGIIICLLVCCLSPQVEFIYSYSLSTSNVLGLGHAQENKTDKIQAHRELTFSWGRQTINRKISTKCKLHEDRKLANFFQHPGLC